MKNYNYISDLVPESQKLTKEYLIANIDYAIDNLVNRHKSVRIQKCRDLYNGIRDKDEYKYLEENYGLGSVTDIKFIPLIKKYVDALIGLFISNEVQYHITCSDSNTINKIKEEKKYKILEVIKEWLEKEAEENIKYFNLFQNNPSAIPPKQIIDERRLDELKRKFEVDWKSEYEIAAQRIIDYFYQNNLINLKDIQVECAKDFIKTGECCYRVYVEEIGKDPVVKYIDPAKIFFDNVSINGTTESATRCVYVEYMTKTEILSKYGHFLTQEEIEYIDKTLDIYTNKLDNPYLGYTAAPSADLRNLPITSLKNLIPVYHVEWLSDNKVIIDSKRHIDRKMSLVKNKNKEKSELAVYRTDRYEGIRIGTDIYVKMGKSNTITRSVSEPYKASLTYRGFYFNYDPTTNTPYSILLATKDLQDIWDILHWHRNDLILRSGISGTRLTYKSIPKELGQQFSERLEKFLGYRKGGIEILDPSGDFNNYGDFNSSADAALLQSINDSLQLIEQTAISVIGVNPELVGQIEEREAVSNVKTSINQTGITVKQLFFKLSNFVKTQLTDLINQARIAYAEGEKAVYLLGPEGKYIFTIDPKYIVNTDFNIHVSDLGVENKLLSDLKEYVKTAAAQGSIDQYVAYKILGSNSVTNIMSWINYYYNKTMQDRVNQEELNSQLQNANLQIQQLQQQLSTLQAKNLDLEERKVKLEEEKVRLSAEEKQARLKYEKEKDKQMLLLKERQLELQKAELLLSSGPRKKVSNVV